MSTNHGAAAMLVLVCGAQAALAQPLYSNGSPDPAVPALNATLSTQSGVPASPGRWWSEVSAAGLFEGNALAGVAAHAAGVAGHFRLADNFAVPAPGWRISGATFLAYATGAVGTGAPFVGVTVRIWDGHPGDPRSRVVYGDTTTNRMASCTPTGIDRVFSTLAGPAPALPDGTRPLWAAAASMTLDLAPGVYWIDFQIVPADPNAGAYVPCVTIPGQRTTPGANAVQLRTSVVSQPAGWIPVVDSGSPRGVADKPQDVVFLITGAPLPVCEPDLNLDGNVDQDDISYLVNVIAGGPNFSGADPDFNRDGNVDQDDVAVLIGVIAGGPCPF